MQFYYVIADPFSQKFKTPFRIYFFPEEIVIATKGIQILLEFYILLTLHVIADPFSQKFKTPFRIYFFPEEIYS